MLGNDAKQVILNVWDFAGGTEYAAGTAHFVVSGLIPAGGAGRVD